MSLVSEQKVIVDHIAGACTPPDLNLRNHKEIWHQAAQLLVKLYPEPPILKEQAPVGAPTQPTRVIQKYHIILKRLASKTQVFAVFKDRNQIYLKPLRLPFIKQIFL